MTRAQQSRFWLIGLASGLVVLGIVVLLPHVIESRVTSIAVDMESNRAGTALLQVNSLQDFRTATITAGARKRYVFTRIDANVRGLALFPLTTSGGTVTIRGITVSDSRQVLARISGRDLAHWAHPGTRLVSVTDTSVTISASGAAPQLGSPTDALAFGRPAWFNPVLKDLLNPEPLTVIVAAVGALILLACGYQRGRRWLIGLPFALVGVVILCFKSVPAWFDSLPSPSREVGYSGYAGHPYVGGEVASVVALGIVVAVAAGAAWTTRRRARDSVPLASDAPSAEPMSQSRFTRGRALAIVSSGLVALLACSLLPDLQQGVANARTGLFSPDFDVDNLVTWTYFNQRGLVAMKDFWYPYGGRWEYLLPPIYPGIFTSSLVTGRLLNFVVEVAILAALFRAVWLLGNRRLGPPLIVTAAFAVLAPTLLGDVWRYSVPVVVALLFATIDRKRGRFGLDHALFAIGFGVSMLLEPTFVLYEGAAIALLLIVDACTDRVVPWRAWRSELRRALGLPMVLGLAFVAVLWARGQLDSTVTFMIHLSDISVYSAKPDPHWGLAHPLTDAFLATIAPFLALGLGLVLRLGKRGQRSGAGTYLLALGAVGFVLLQKDLVRPAPSILIFVPVLGAIGAAALTLSPPWTALRAATAGGFAALVISLAVLGGLLSSAVSNVADLPGNTWSDASLVVRHRGVIGPANAARFSDDHFAGYSSELAAVRAVRAHQYRPPYYVLWGSPVLYVLLGNSTPPFQINSYNMAPLYEQQRTVDWLIHKRPSVILWDPRAVDPDLLPQPVRIPIVFDQVIRTYTPAGTAGDYELLVPRKRGQPLAGDYWRSKLGSRLDLGSIPAAAALPNRPCNTTRADCGEFLLVHLSRNLARVRSITLPIRIGGTTFRLAFRGVPGSSDYTIPLDRVWFWSIGRSSGLPSRVGPAALVGVRERVVHRIDDQSILY